MQPLVNVLLIANQYSCNFLIRSIGFRYDKKKTQFKYVIYEMFAENIMKGVRKMYT